MTRPFAPYSGFDPCDGDDPRVTLSRDNPLRPRTVEVSGVLVDGPAGPEFLKRDVDHGPALDGPGE